MTFSAPVILALSVQCAPNVAPLTVAALVMTESGGRPFALNVDGGPRVKPQFNAADAAAVARQYVAAGYSVDLGLGQINSRNMHKLDLTWETVFDPCTNIAALGRMLSQDYRAVADGRDPQAALRLALSLYNTGNSSRGFRNGYVAKVVANAGVISDVTAEYPERALPLTSPADVRNAVAVENSMQPPLKASRRAPPPAWNLFERAAYDRETVILSATERGTIL